MKQILIVEDSTSWQRAFAASLRGRIDLVQAYSLAEGIAAFDSRSSWDAIFSDGCLDGEGFNAPELIMHVRRRYDGPFIAISSMHNLRQRMITYGCSDECQKSEVVAYIERAFGV